MERVPCEPDPSCKFYKSKSCYQNRHHLWWPKRNYTTPLEKRLREAPEAIEVMCRANHERLHLREKPPQKPTVDEIKVILRSRNVENIRDRGNSERRAEQIQGVVAFLGQVTGDRVMPQKVYLERTGLAQDEFDAHGGWDDNGTYHDPTLRLER